MMRNTFLIVAGLGLLLANVARAQNREDEGLAVGDYAASIEAKEWINVDSKDDPPSLAELRGMVVVLFFWVSWHEGGEALLPYVNMFSYSPQIGRAGGVYTIGITNAQRKETQPLIDEAKIFFPVACESESAQEYGFQNGFGFIVVGPDGKIIYKGDGSGNLGAMQDGIAEAINASPPTKTHPDEAKICFRNLDEARNLFIDKKYHNAYKIIQSTYPRAVLGDRLSSQILELEDLMELLGYDELGRFDLLFEKKKFDQAAEVLRLVVKRFRGLGCYKEAKRTYKKLREEDEDFKKAAARFDNEDTAARIYLEARDNLKARRLGECYNKLNQIVTDYSATEAAQYAEAMLARMKKNKAVWALVLDHQAAAECKQMLARARNLISRGRTQDAESLLRRIMAEFPDTKWAEEAMTELKNMPK